ncbi:ribonuclease III [Coraliomargarita parva]|uniref:ribonuclease III n=1 Tax=Coraliomargarita parva TaxID=3014050 RepID=UPI0022B3FB64|nr:ribonuclease III [Coraliomargarita parva]
MSRIHSTLLQAIGYEFRDSTLLESALTHPSTEGDVVNYQRLEFLGDSVLGMLVADFLYHMHPDKPEGALDRMRAGLVNGSALAAKARELGLDRGLIVSDAQKEHLPEPSDAMLEDAFEALVAAIYLDGGIDSVRSWVRHQLQAEIEQAEQVSDRANPKGRLQEWSQREHAGLTPEYVLTAEEGPDHAKSYTVTVFIGDQKLASGSGSSKKAAETSAAEATLEQLLDR